jgi:hypothetical protein
MIGGKVVVEPPSVVGIVALLMSMKSQFLSMSFHTHGRVDVEPPSVADSSARIRADESPRAWQVAVDANVVDDFEDEVVEVFSSSCFLLLLFVQ